MFELYNSKITAYKKTLTSDTRGRTPYISGNLRLCIVDEGCADWRIGDRLCTVTDGDMVILNNHQTRIFENITKTITLTVIEFEPQFIINTQLAGLFLRDNGLSPVITGNEKIVRLAHEICAELEEELIDYRIICEVKLIEILTLIRRHYGISAVIDPHPNICKALEYIKHNYKSDELSLSVVANQLHMSMYSFSKLFSRQMNIGFTQYVMQKRVHHAISLLEKTDMTILSIALECGFNSTASFYKAFRKLTGNVPGHYRKPHDDFRI